MFEGLDFKNMGKMMEEMQEKASAMQEQSKSVQMTAKGGGGMI
ncbi:MAG TPA: nucleoid-associated protein, partial [Sulfurovum sp.]|nr:nucleoid-associated protein [Sulfurovum sp.]